MPKLFRLFCVCLGVTIVVALQAHGAINSQHRIEHGVQFPGVSYADMAEIEHGHDHDQDRDHAPAESSPLDDGPVLDVADTVGGDGPIKHHHHSGGDVHVALITAQYPVQAGLMDSASLGQKPDLVPPGFSRDGPSHPPKQLRLIA
jgi:hypothetical protein